MNPSLSKSYFPANQTIADGAPKVKRTMLPCGEGKRQIRVSFRRPIWYNRCGVREGGPGVEKTASAQKKL